MLHRKHSSNTHRRNGLHHIGDTIKPGSVGGAHPEADSTSELYTLMGVLLAKVTSTRIKTQAEDSDSTCLHLLSPSCAIMAGTVRVPKETSG